MILTKTLIIKKKGNNKISYYENLGYDIYSDIIVNINDVLPNSNVVIDVVCDFCKKSTKVKYKNYNRNINRSDSKKYACCRKCSIEKTILTNLKRYGNKYPIQNKNISNAVKSTNLEKYGSESVFGSDIIKKKIKDTNLEKYGSESVFGSDIIKKKIKDTNLEKYGSENVFGSDIIKEKIKNTNKKRYGSEYYVTSSEYIEQLDIIKSKIRNKFILKYGSHPMISDEFRSKFKVSNNNYYLSYIDNSISLFKCDCKKDHTFEISSDNYRGRVLHDNPLCTICYPINEPRL